jgi:hypothetical protein
MKCPKCDFVQSDQNIKCSKCGIIFEKYQKHQTSALRKGAVTTKEEGTATEDGTFFQRVAFFVSQKLIPFTLVVGLP